MIADNVGGIQKLLGNVKLVAVTKGQSAEKINEAIRSGVTIIGENYVQEAEQKFPSVLQSTRHFIGHLQTNKVKTALKLFDCIQSVDSEKILAKLSDAGACTSVFLQVNLGEEETKCGFFADDVGMVVKKWDEYPGVAFNGIMAVAPLGDAESNRPLFRRLAKIFLEIKQLCPSLHELSMGTSNDYRVAVEEGATMVRLGTALFGERN